ncbi:unnamed protein product [Effrenium voratum]|uniref:Uncharacterized protein n=1 Tax=Effrenium voratum TaxID=2562239 RepID=A0AA36HSF1_9DINO|nr:unnamed protein product [Effrenium voratum]
MCEPAGVADGVEPEEEQKEQGEAPDQADGAREALKAFKRKLEESLKADSSRVSQKESLRAGIIPSSGGRAKRKAAAAADERVREQLAMERGLIKSRKMKPEKQPKEAKEVERTRRKEDVQPKPAKPKKKPEKSKKSEEQETPDRLEMPETSAKGSGKRRPEAQAPEVAPKDGPSSNSTASATSPASASSPSTGAPSAPSAALELGGDDLQGLVSLAAAARLPKRLGNCGFDASGRDWVPRGQVSNVPKARRSVLLKGYTHQAEKSKTGVAACKCCGVKIAKATLRVGYPVKDHRGNYGAIVNWLHLECARADETLMAYAKMGEVQLGKRVLGVEAMTKEERLECRETLLRPEVKAPLELPAVQTARQLAAHPSPKNLKLPLLAFQAEGLGWMLEREADKLTRGGILADEMGMGKTLQTISLILAGAPGATLVVCPAAAMLQWRNEILRFTEPGSLEVRLYYGTEKKEVLGDLMNEQILLRRVVVLTTYQTLEYEYRQQVNLTKVQCQWCGRLYQKEKLFYHQRYFCGPDAQRTEKQMKARRKADYKDEAVKKMKIGGAETNIVLNPLNAIRSAATSALRRRKPANGAMPFPVSVLPEEAQASLRGRGPEGKKAESETSKTSETSETRRRSRPSATSAVTTKAAESARSARNAWGTALKASTPSTKVIELTQSDDSDLELTHEVGSMLAFGSSSAPSAPSAPSAASAPAPSAREASEDDMDLSRSALYRTLWGRVVLDEAHRIKTRTNSTAQAAFALRVDGSRWCLSGTPLQNRVGEFWSIIRFIQFYPYAHYLCSKKGCSCASLHYRFDPETSKCRKCGHTKMQHRSHFVTEVSNPIKKFGFIGAGKKAMELLRTEVLDRILLRRTKLERAADVKLPTLSVRIRKDGLSSQERDFYTAMYTQGRTQFDTYVESGTVLHNYAHVFDLIMRLRQAVDHPYLIIHGSLNAPDPSAGLIPTKSRGFADICALCQDDVEGSRAKATCGHAFHRDCLQEYLEQAPQLPSGGVGCPTCFMPLTWAEDQAADDGDDVVADVLGEELAAGEQVKEKPQSGSGKGGRNSIMQKIKTSEFRSSTKIEALMQEIKRMEEADSTSKALVFSQFTRFLEIIEWRLKREGISAATVLGSMPIVARNNIIVSFQTEPTLKVLLISLKAGGEGLNLQAADHIFLMDPWWNPAAEAQAIQRAHRIGQLRPVKAIRFVAAETIEEKIVELQEKKQTVFDCTVGNCNQALQRLSSEDIQFLFSS